uniref:Biotin carboxyl carrier protein of acetyl-CoA carboxylase n=1 Tax=Geranium maderense TaxID=28964 RepID=A0A286SC20_9ROSI|nr:biotin carboxyl carrier protein subunit [Geranium maderense]
MASSLTTATSSLSKSFASSNASFRLSPKPSLRFFSKDLQPSWNFSTVARAQVNEVAVDGSSKAAFPTTESEVKEVEAEDDGVSEASSREESISEFIAQVANLVKLVDSRDIAELELKQHGCELLIRKKEAMPQPPAPAPAQYMMHHSPPPAAATPPAAAPSPPPTASAPAPASLPAPPGAKSSHPPLLCPMPGTFYRSPAPGAPPFVMVGDKVQKGQVICIIEAMKLMNEIEADKAGTIAEILLEDGKPVSVGTAIFVIEP